MKIALVNTYPHGGAGIACRRLQQALQGAGHEVVLLTRENAGKSWPFYAERLSFLPYEKDKSVRFAYSLANFGTSLLHHPDILSADIIHLHWVNQGFLSLKNIRELTALGKPVFWTLHDMWAFTGGCHYNRGCLHFQTAPGCGNCPMLRNPGSNDLSQRIITRKSKNYAPDIHFVTCSRWLEGEARSSFLLKNADIVSLPNPVDTSIFKPLADEERMAIRHKLGIEDHVRLILFVAMNVADERKGFHYLEAALQWLKKRPGSDNYQVLVLGKADPAAMAVVPFPIHTPGMLTDWAEMSKYYSIADVFVVPSLEDNLPNTVMEALASGTPVAGFPTGGIPEMVDHLESGFITNGADGTALGEAIEFILEDDNRLQTFSRNARLKVERCYANAVVAGQFTEAYKNALQR